MNAKFHSLSGLRSFVLYDYFRWILEFVHCCAQGTALKDQELEKQLLSKSIKD